jgi:two-component system CheB/CheR fusion protein
MNNDEVKDPDVSAQDPASRAFHVLLVEDSADILFLLQKELEWAGYQVSTAADGAAAIEVAERILPDLIISDIRMPELDGYEFIRLVRQIPALASVPAIAMTGFDRQSDIDMANSAGYNAHLVKPVDVDQLCQWIEKLRKHNPPSGAFRP